MLESLTDTLLERAALAVKLARAAGADGAFAWSTRNRFVEVNYRDGALEKVQESTSSSLSLKLYVGGKYSSHSTTDARRDRLEAFIKETVALTRALESDPHRALPDPALFEGRSEVDLDLVDAGLSDLSADEREGWCKEMNALVMAHEGVISATSGAYNDHSVRAGVSSNGFEGAYETTSVWRGASAVLKEEGDKRLRGGTWVGGHHLDQFQWGPEQITAEALRLAERKRGASKGPTTRAVMVVDPRASSRLIGYLLRPANAKSIQQGRSFLADKVGEPITNAALTLVDDPLVARGLSSRYFDGEGLAAKPMTLIEGGVLKNLFVDTYYGGKAGLTPTTGGSSNLLATPGDRDLAGLLADAGSGVYITGWLGGNSDNNTGDFSFGCRGHLIENGVVGAPITEMNVTGNLLDLFANLAAVGNDPWPWSSTKIGSLMFEDVQFSGA